MVLYSDKRVEVQNHGYHEGLPAIVHPLGGKAYQIVCPLHTAAVYVSLLKQLLCLREIQRLQDYELKEQLEVVHKGPVLVALIGFRLLLVLIVLGHIFYSIEVGGCKGRHLEVFKVAWIHQCIPMLLDDLPIENNRVILLNCHFIYH